MKSVAVYPGSFDPITNGHIDIIQRAAKLFDTLIVAVGCNTRKQVIFNLEERMAMLREVLRDFSNVKIESFTGILVEFAAAKKATVIVRGLRGHADFDSELQLANMNHMMASAIETVFLPASMEFVSISATLVKEIVLLGGDVKAFVPEIVAERLLHRVK